MKQAHAAQGLDPPDIPEVKPIPRNIKAWRAWSLVNDCRVWTMGGVGPLDWTSVKAVLDLYGLWTADIHRKLRICISEMLKIEISNRENK